MKHAMASQNVLAVQQPHAGELSTSYLCKREWRREGVRCDTTHMIENRAAPVRIARQREPFRSGDGATKARSSTAARKCAAGKNRTRCVEACTAPQEAAPVVGRDTDARTMPAPRLEAAEPLSVPPVIAESAEVPGLRLSRIAGRTLCVDCEQKQWRGDSLPQPVLESLPLQDKDKDKVQPRLDAPTVNSPDPRQISAASSPPRRSPNPPPKPLPVFLQPIFLRPVFQMPRQMHRTSRRTIHYPLTRPQCFQAQPPTPNPGSRANKYVLGALLVIAVIIAVIVWRR